MLLSDGELPFPGQRSSVGLALVSSEALGCAFCALVPVRPADRQRGCYNFAPSRLQSVACDGVLGWKQACLSAGDGVWWLHGSGDSDR